MADEIKALAALAAEPTGGSVKSTTAYVVLALDDPIDTPDGAKKRWLEVGNFTARSAEAAVRQYAEKVGGAKPLTLMACPVRNVHRETLAPKTVTTWETEP